MLKRHLTKMWMMLVVASMFLSGCLYTDIQVPRAYRSASPIDVKAQVTDKVVVGESCNQSVLFLVAWGNGGYVGAIGHALMNEPTSSILYDVHVDVKATAYLFGLYTRTCTVVTGKVGSV